MLRKIILVFNILLLCGSGVLAQTNHLQHTYLDVNAGMSVLKNSFTRTWDQPVVLNLESRIDFYSGQLGGGIRYSRFNSSEELEEGAGFQSFFAYLGWEYTIPIGNNLQLHPGLRFGNNFMLFDKGKTYSEPWPYSLDPQESEFSYELFVRTSYTIPKTSWALHAVFSYNRTLTYHPLSTALISFGISRSFKSPSWLKTLIK
ncbi:MAG: hypothetical protein U5K69_11555 [Balneolaceae bacterium]|nr:hypothetical protein [Balneolaceae bacterium]